MKIDRQPTLPRSLRWSIPVVLDKVVTGPRDALQAAYDRAVKRFGAIPGAQIAVCSSTGSGNKPIIALRHQGGNPEAVRVQTHFHGDQLYDASVGFDKEIGASVDRAWQKNPDTVIVLPESKNENQAPRCDWNNISRIDRIERDALKSLGLDPQKVVYRALSGHSSGGSVLAKTLARGNAEQLGPLNRVELYDAAVSSQHNSVSDGERQRAQKWCSQNQKRILLVPGIMQSSWLSYVDRSRWTEKAKDHWSPVWQSLGQFREPASSAAGTATASSGATAESFRTPG